MGLDRSKCQARSKSDSAGRLVVLQPPDVGSAGSIWSSPNDGHAILRIIALEAAPPVGGERGSDVITKNTGFD